MNQLSAVVSSAGLGFGYLCTISILARRQTPLLSWSTVEISSGCHQDNPPYLSGRLSMMKTGNPRKDALIWLIGLQTLHIEFHALMLGWHDAPTSGSVGYWPGIQESNSWLHPAWGLDLGGSGLTRVDWPQHHQQHLVWLCTRRIHPKTSSNRQVCSCKWSVCWAALVHSVWIHGLTASGGMPIHM
jgi:hypothetical protein